MTAHGMPGGPRKLFGRRYERLSVKPIDVVHFEKVLAAHCPIDALAFADLAGFGAKLYVEIGVVQAWPAV